MKTSRRRGIPEYFLLDLVHICTDGRRTEKSGFSTYEKLKYLNLNQGMGFSSLLNNTSCCVLSRFSSVQLIATPWTVALQVPLFMGFSRQEYWSGLPCPPPGDLPSSGIKLAFLLSPALAGGFFATQEVPNNSLPQLLIFCCQRDVLARGKDSSHLFTLLKAFSIG